MALPATVTAKRFKDDPSLESHCQISTALLPLLRSTKTSSLVENAIWNTVFYPWDTCNSFWYNLFFFANYHTLAGPVGEVTTGCLCDFATVFLDQLDLWFSHLWYISSLFLNKCFTINYHTIGVFIKVQILCKTLDYSVSVVQTLLHWWEKEQVFGVAVCFAHSGGLLFGNSHSMTFVIQRMVLKWKCIIRRAVARSLGRTIGSYL